MKKSRINPEATSISLAQIEFAYVALQHHLATVVSFGVSSDVFWDPIAKQENNMRFHKVLGLHEMLSPNGIPRKIGNVVSDITDRIVWVKGTVFSNTELKILEEALHSYINRCVQDPEFDRDPTPQIEVLTIITKN